MGKKLKYILILLVIFMITRIISRVFGESVQPPEPRNRCEVEAILTRVPKPSAQEKLRKLNIVLVADVKDHKVDEHDYPLWQKRWHLLLAGKENCKSTEEQVNLYGPPSGTCRKETLAGALNVSVTTAWQWPDAEQFKTADLVVVFCYIEWNEQKLEQLDAYLCRGGGFVVVHSATWTKPKPSLEVARLTGVGGYELFRHGPVEMNITDTNNPICIGLPETIQLIDETYWPAKYSDPNKICVLATSVEKIEEHSDGTTPQPILWTYEYDSGRVFGCVLGHYVWTFDDPYFRILLLRGMAWAAGESPYRFDSLVLRGARLRTELQENSATSKEAN